MFRLFICLLLALVASAKFSEWETNPKYCEVCIGIVNDIKEEISYSDRSKNVASIEGYLSRHCHKYHHVVMHDETPLCRVLMRNVRALSTPLSHGMSAIEICKILQRTNPHVCDHEYTSEVHRQKKKKVNEEAKNLEERRGIKKKTPIKRSDL
ncbi:hypothetical protein N9A45_01635 [bacterium]|nr:hypothetical protein [bacterium]